MPWGLLALHNRKVPAVPEVLYGCVVAQENPHVPLLFPFLAVMLFARFQWGIFGESPDEIII